MLAAHSHMIEFTTLEGQEDWVKNKEYEFIAKVHLLGTGLTEDQLEAHYHQSQKWDVSKGLGALMESKYLFDSFWPQTYHSLKDIMDDLTSRLDMMIVDFFVEVVKNIHVEYQLLITVVWPNIPFLMMPCSYIPGQPGFQLEGTLTSKTASMWLHIKNELVMLTGLGTILKWVNWTKQMHQANGIYYSTHHPQKSDYLVLVNSFFGLEIPRDLPPTCAPVGLLLSPTYPPLDTSCQEFLGRCQSVLYIGLGTHIILLNQDAVKIINGVMHLLQEGLIDRVIWAISQRSHQGLNRNQTFQTKPDSTTTTTTKLSDLLTNKHPNWLFPFFAPQRAILDHESTKLYFTHGGGSSTNKALYHGKPLLIMGFFFNQIANTTHLVAAGVAKSLSKFHFTSNDLYDKVKQILIQSNGKKDGDYLRNVLCMKHIAHIATNCRNFTADLVEGLMYDNELCFGHGGQELQPMHLQTAEIHMPVYKAKNWDLYAVCLLGASALVGSMWFTGRLLWMICAPMVEWVKGLVGEGLGFVFKW